MDDIEVKRMYSADDRRAMAKAGDALPDGSFPIKDKEDLKNAIQAFGRAAQRPPSCTSSSVRPTLALRTSFLSRGAKR
jgi:hypothetical protein